MDEDKNQHKGSEDDKPGGHGHGHSHDHSVPRTLSALVWRVVVGDGIHNFSDGIAVGVAFASSVTGGFSTSVAVLCHELPHEMGLCFSYEVTDGGKLSLTSPSSLFFGCVLDLNISNIYSYSSIYMYTKLKHFNKLKKDPPLLTFDSDNDCL